MAMNRWMRLALLLLVGCSVGGGVYYHDVVYQVEQIKDEVGSYAETATQDTDALTHDNSYRKCMAIISTLFSKARGNSERFAVYLMDEGSSILPKDEKAAREWMQSQVEQFYFPQAQLQGALVDCAETFASATREATNLLARKVDVDFGYAFPDGFRLNSSAIEDRYAALIGHSIRLMEIEGTNYWLRIGSGLAAGVVAQALVAPSAKLIGLSLGGRAGLIGAGVGLAVGAAIDCWTYGRDRQKLVDQLTQVLSGTETEVINGVVEPMESERKKQMDGLRHELEASLLEHRLAVRSWFIKPRTAKWLHGSV